MFEKITYVMKYEKIGIHAPKSTFKFKFDNTGRTIHKHVRN